MFGEKGPETVIPGTGHKRGPVATFGDIHVHNEADGELIRQKLSYAVVRAGMGS